MRVTDQAIADFISTLNLGLEWIKDAGKKLANIVDTNPGAFDDILEAAKLDWLTREVLETIEDIGRGLVEPEALLMPRHVLARIAAWPVGQQIQAMQSPVEVAKPDGRGGYHRVYKPLPQLTASEARRAISKVGFRTAADQAERFHSGKAENYGKFLLSLVGGKPVIGPVNTSIPDCQKQRVKLIDGKALLELYD